MNFSFEQWIDCLFEHDEAEGDWRFDMEMPLDDISNELVVDYTIKMYENFAGIIQGFSDWQLGMGLYYLYSNTYSNLVYAFHDESIELKKRLKAISLMSILYQDCFAKRCHEVLGHKSEKGSELDSFNYMLWDVTPLIFCPENTDKKFIYTALEDVLAFALSIKHIGCIESGLHGLGHFMLEHEEASKLASAYIRNPTVENEELLAYAKQAEVGYVL